MRRCTAGLCWIKHITNFGFRAASCLFYLAYLDGVPIATSAAIQTGNQASIEFVSTLQQYRNQGAASALCLKKPSMIYIIKVYIQQP
ncbi:GNAT family N-acetyltransferase [Paenibacillus rhizoplanae]